MSLSKIAEYRNWIVAIIIILTFVFTLGSSARSDVIELAREYTDNKVETIDAKLDYQKEAIEKISVKIDRMEGSNKKILEGIIRCQNERD